MKRTGATRGKFKRTVGAQTRVRLPLRRAHPRTARRGTPPAPTAVLFAHRALLDTSGESTRARGSREAESLRASSRASSSRVAFSSPRKSERSGVKFRRDGPGVRGAHREAALRPLRLRGLPVQAVLHRCDAPPSRTSPRRVEASSWIQNVTPLETTLEMSRLPSLTFFSPRLSVPFVPHPPPQSSR